MPIHTTQHLLIVEGADDAGVFRSLCQWLGLSQVQVFAIHGTSKFKAAIQAAARLPLSALGLVRDADDSRDAAFKSLQGTLHRNGLPVPTAPRVFADGPPRTGIIILPPSDIGTGRALEDVLFESVRTPALDAIVTEYVGFFAEQGLELRELDVTKARIHAYLGAQNAPGLTIAEAAQRGLWNFEHEVFSPLRQFLQELRA